MWPPINQGWDLLPDELLLNIFKRLSQEDLVRASSTCHHWRNIYHEPSLWRSKTFDLRQPHTQKLQGLRTFLFTLGHHVRRVHIICPTSSAMPSNQLCRYLDTLLTELSALNNDQQPPLIYSFTLSKLYFHSRWNMADISPWQIQSLSQFFEGQTQLREVGLQAACLMDPGACRILISLSRSPSVRTLEVLNIVDYSHLLLIHNEAKILLQTLYRSCTNLEEIRMNYTYLRAADIPQSWESIRNSLKSLHIYATFPTDTMAVDRDLITPEQWRQVCWVMPRLKVYFYSMCLQRDVRKFLVPDMPLVSISWTEWVTPSSAISLGDQVTRLLDHLAQLTLRSLESATFATTGRICPGVSRDSVVRFVDRCQGLRELNLGRTLTNEETVGWIRSEVDQRLKRNPEFIYLV